LSYTAGTMWPGLKAPHGPHLGEAPVLTSGTSMALAPDEPQEAAGEPAQASEGTDTSEPDSASQSATEAEETLRKVAEWTAKNNVVIKDPDFQAEINSFSDSDEEEESDDPLDGLDEEFEAFLSSGAVMDRPSYHPEDEVFLR
jgi:hypothetical protein